MVDQSDKRGELSDVAVCSWMCFSTQADTTDPTPQLLLAWRSGLDARRACPETDAVCGILGESGVKASLCSHAGQIGMFCAFFYLAIFFSPFHTASERSCVLNPFSPKARRCGR